jgi:N-acetylneuraminic acid mutarotase
MVLNLVRKLRWLVDSYFRYAMGGYDGIKMVSSVEIYDPRLNAWRMGEPMTAPRGYAAAVNVDNSLFLIGGMRSNVQILDTVSNHLVASMHM